MEPNFLVKHKYFLICMIPNIMILFGYYENYIKNENGIVLFRHVDGIKPAYTDLSKYLVDTKNCKIPDISPLNSDVWPYFQKQDYIPCTTINLLTYIEKNALDNFLKINFSTLHSYTTSNDISCRYANVTRGKGNDIDNSISFSDYQEFNESVKLSSDLVKVICDSSGSEVYSNVHRIIHRNFIGKSKSNDFSYSVLLVGIDTMSRLNLIRTMPKTYRFLEKTNWINLRGYNKIDDNTFPNLMAILSGMNLSQVTNICKPEENVLDDCDIIWRKFQQSHYLTAYAEDEAFLNTFNYFLKGFNNTPTDFYFRPYFLAAETLTVAKQYLLSYCTGPETSGERVLNLIKDFIQTFPEELKFGLFWMNTFSHNNINTASGMDEVFENFLNSMMKYLDNTIMIFFSDHGFRFGKIRYTYSGWLEERLPFNYIWIPPSFQHKYPQSYENLQINSNKLTTPYDVYMTLQDILARSDENYQIQPSLACPKCKSLFEKIEENRSCDNASISQHLCTCMGHVYIDPNSKIVKKAAYFALDKLKSNINSFREGRKCANYDLKHIISSGITETFYNTEHQSFNYLLIVFETFPKAVFEATVSISYQNYIPLFTLQGIISRVDRYGNTSACVSSPILRKYCHCDGFYTTMKKTIDILFNN